MRWSDEIGELAKALVGFQRAVGSVRKEAKNPHFRSQYTTLGDLLEGIREAKGDHGLAVVQGPGYDRGDGMVEITTRILHESGQWVEDELSLPVAKDTPQGLGSAITYGRRYTVGPLLGIPETDDDGNGAEEALKTHADLVGARAKIERLTQELREASAGAAPRDTVPDGARRADLMAFGRTRSKSGTPVSSWPAESRANFFRSLARDHDGGRLFDEFELWRTMTKMAHVERWSQAAREREWTVCEWREMVVETFGLPIPVGEDPRPWLATVPAWLAEGLEPLEGRGDK